LGVGGGIDSRRAERRRDEARRRTYRRRRLLAIGGLIALVVALIVGVGSLGGSGTKAPAGSASGGAKTKSSQSAAAIQGPTVSGDAARKVRAPILEYHSISVPPSGASLPELFTPTADFTAELNYMKSQGYEAITLDQLFAGWSGKAPIPEKPVVVSMDDGYLTQYTHALPVLQKLGWPGVLNLKLQSLDPGQEMTPTMIKKMIAAGWEIDDHTITHPDVTTLSPASLQHEVGDSRTMLQRQFGIPVNFFCYPAGKFNDAAIAGLKRAGYTGATTEIIGFASSSGDPFKLPRVEILGSGGLTGFKQKLAQAASS
jgi:peptidoglycan/xylan/chitin deacetylase (PgdA/CDA1 family)